MRSNTRQYKLRRFPNGFTIVELLIVIVVIATLAAIAILAYTGVTNRAIEATLKSDLKSGATKVELVRTTNGSYPDTEGVTLESSNDNIVSYRLVSPNEYCIDAVNGAQAFRLLGSVGIIETGTCDDEDEDGDSEPLVTTLAGSTQGYANSTGSDARFNNPSSIVIASDGSLYVTDSGNNRIRQVTTDGVVTTFAGSGTAGVMNGQGTSARFNTPFGITVDTAGYFYVTDADGDVVRRISSGGAVTTFAGSGTAGFSNGTGTASNVRFNFPTGISIDTSGNLYVSDMANHDIRHITSSAVVTMYAGNSYGAEGFADGNNPSMVGFNYPLGVAVNTTGDVFVADSQNNRIRKITPLGVVSTFAGSAEAGLSDGNGTSARFNNPCGIAIGSDGSIYVADSGNNAIRKITPAGDVTTLAGGSVGSADGLGTNAQFNNPLGLAISNEGIIYVADSYNHRIRKIEL